jgi:hypothetical protein
MKRPMPFEVWSTATRKDSSCGDRSRACRNRRSG